eukprot:jgi/Botrbrau1/12603/Bobra.0169s0131.1
MGAGMITVDNPRPRLENNSFYALSPLYECLPYINMTAAFTFPLGHALFLGVFKKLMKAILGLSNDLEQGQRLQTWAKKLYKERLENLVLLPCMAKEDRTLETGFVGRDCRPADLSAIPEEWGGMAGFQCS